MILNILATLTACAGALASLTLVVLCIASAPNSTPRAAARLKRILALTVLGGAALLVSAVWAIVAGRPLIGAILGGLPIATLFVLIVVVQRSRR